MFSWSTNRTRTGSGVGGADSFTYPGHRRSGVGTSPSSSAVTAPVIQGTIRPPVYGYTYKQHLDSYLHDTTLSRSTRKCANDPSSYDTVFQTVKGETLKLRVRVPNTGSNDAKMSVPPTMYLAGVRASHDWLDSGGTRIVGHPALLESETWKRANALLGTIVHEVVKHLQLNPPNVHAFTDARLYSMQNNTIQQATPLIPAKTAAATSTAEKTPPPPDYHAAFRQGPPPPPPPSPLQDDTDLNALVDKMPVSAVKMPSIPTKFDDLDTDDRELLDGLLKSDVQLISYCNDSPIVKELQSISLSIIEENARIAKEHLQKEEELKRLHTRAKTLETELKQKVERFHELKMRQDSVCAPPDAIVVRRQLHDAKKHAFEKSERYAEVWVDDEDKDTSVDDFCNQFLEQRMVHHARAAKLELLQRNNNNNGTNGSRIGF